MEGKGKLQFGTKVVNAADGSVAALLGASPGASIAVHTMLDVMKKCFPQEFVQWQPKIQEMIPSYGFLWRRIQELFRQIQASTSETLGLNR